MYKAIIDKLTAAFYARACFRDGPIEDYHSEGKLLGADEYRRMEEEFARLFAYCENGILGKRSLDDQEYQFICCLAASAYRELETPVIIRNRFNTSIADFVLKGKVKKACEKHAVITDDNIHELTQDVYSRMYTLVRNGQIAGNLSNLSASVKAIVQREMSE